MRNLLILFFISFHLLYAQTITIEHQRDDLKININEGKARLDLNRYRNVSMLANRSGVPALPSYIYKVELASGTVIGQINIERTEETLLEGKYDIVPQQALGTQDTPPAPVEPDANIYKRDQRYPKEIVQFTGVKSFNGKQIAHFVVTPIQYNPVTKQLFLINKIHLSYSSEEMVKKAVQPFLKKDTHLSNYLLNANVDDRTATANIQMYEHGLSPEDVTSGLIDRYVIITTEEFAEAMQPLAEWKIQKGVPTVIRTLGWIQQEFPNGVDLAEKMRNFIRWSYENRGTKYVLLAGDREYVPTRIIRTIWNGDNINYAADYYFADLDGTWNDNQNNIFGETQRITQNDTIPSDNLDGYPETYVSRIPVRSVADIERFTEKLFQYEKLTGLSEGDNFPANVLYTAANIGLDNDGYDWIIKHIDPEINPSFTRKMLTQNIDIGSDPSVALAELNKNYGITFTESHGTAYTIRPGGRGSNLYNYDMNGLTNTMPGLWYVASCYTNDIRKRAISEEYMLSPNGGGVAYIGNSSYEFPASGIFLQEDFFNLVFTQGFYHLAEAHYLSRLEFLGYLNYEGPSRIIVYSTIALGDPEMPIWTAAPSGFEIAQKDSAVNGQSRFFVKVENENTAAPVNDAAVVLYKKGQLYKMQYTDAAGFASFNRNELSVDSVYMTVSKHNFKPNQERINFQLQSGPVLELNQHTLTDVGGNGNQICEPGESFELNIQLKNSGDRPTPEYQQDDPLIVRVNSSYSHITWNQNEQTISESILPGEQRWIGPYQYSIDTSCPKDTVILVQIDFIHDSTLTHRLNIPLEIHLPMLAVKNVFIKTTEIGSKKSSMVHLDILNNGSGAASGLQMIVSCMDSTVEIIQTPSLPRYMEPDAFFSTEEPIVFRHTNSADSIQLLVRLTDMYGKTWRYNINFDNPKAVEQLEFKPSSANGIQLSWLPSQSDDVLGYHIFRRTDTEDTYQCITDAALPNAGYFIDEAIEPNSLNSYYVQTVDSSGNLSTIASDTITAWPSLLFQQNFPQQISIAGVSAPANGVISYDLDNNGTCEIIVSGANGTLNVYNSDAALLYAVEGMEGYLTVPAIGNVFGDETKEIVVSAQYERTDKNWLFIIDAFSGTLLHAIHLQYNVPTTVVLKDINLDGYEDIILFTHAPNAPEGPKDSRLWIWKSTGSDWQIFDEWSEDGYHFSTAYAMGMPAAADMTNSGIISIIASVEKKGLYCFQPMDSSEAVWMKTSGEVANDGTSANLNSPISLADIDADGNLDILLASVKNDKLYAFNHLGDALPGWETGIGLETTDFWGYSSPAIMGNLDSDIQLEIVYVGRDSVYLLEHDGSNMPGWPKKIAESNSYISHGYGLLSPYNSPVLADLNQDGQPEIIFISTFGILHALDSQTGEEIAGFTINTGNDLFQGQSPVIDDVDRDGDLEVILIDQDGFVKIWDAPGKYNQTSELYWNQPFANVQHSGELDTTKIKIISGIEEELAAGKIPEVFTLHQNYPNPFNPSTSIKYEVARQGNVELSVYNILGQKVRTLVNRKQAPGTYSLKFDATGLASGIYIYRLTVDNGLRQTKKMILLR